MGMIQFFKLYVITLYELNSELSRSNICKRLVSQCLFRKMEATLMRCLKALRDAIKSMLLKAPIFFHLFD